MQGNELRRETGSMRLFKHVLVVAAVALVFASFLVPLPLGFGVEDKFYHVIVFAAVAIVAGRYIPLPKSSLRWIWVVAMAAFTISAVSGILVELAQVYIPGRVAAPVDVGFNLAGAALGIPTVAWLEERVRGVKYRISR